MEWITGGGSNEVDIGYVPLLRVFSSSPSVPWRSDHEFQLETFNDSSIVWDQEISTSDVMQEIEQTMYPFRKVSNAMQINFEAYTECVHGTYMEHASYIQGT